MKLNISKKDIELMKLQGIECDSERDYTEDEALDLLEAVRDSEAYYAQGADKESKRLYKAFCDLGDLIHRMIPEE